MILTEQHLSTDIGIMENSLSIFIPDLSPSITEFMLYGQFSPSVSIQTIELFESISHNKCKYRYAIITFHSFEDTDFILKGMNNSVFCSNLPPDMSSENLYQVFSQVGVVFGCRVATQGEDEISLGYGFVNFFDKKSAKAAIERFNHQVVNKHELTVTRISKSQFSSTPENWTNVNVLNLPPNWQKRHLIDEFAKFGPIANAIVATNKKLHHSLQFGFVDFVFHQDAVKAVEAIQVDTKALITVNRSLPGGGRWEMEGRNCFVRDIPLGVDAKMLQDEFSSFGEIVFCNVLQQEEVGKLNIGYVCFSNKKEAKSFLAKRKKHLFGGTLEVMLVSSKEKRMAKRHVEFEVCQPISPNLERTDHKKSTHFHLNPAAQTFYPANWNGTDPILLV